jgi:hypothetical protein
VIGGAIINDAGKHDVNSFGDRPGWVEENALDERDAIGSRIAGAGQPFGSDPRRGPGACEIPGPVETEN